MIRRSQMWVFVVDVYDAVVDDAVGQSLVPKYGNYEDVFII